MKKFRIKYVLFPIFTLVIAIMIFIGFKIVNKTENSMTMVLPWKEKSNDQKFLEVEYDGNIYYGIRNKTINSMIGEKIGVAIMKGYDVYTKNTYTQNASLYTINTISKDCAIAVQFEDDLDYYIYINNYYRPNTLGDLINDLNLRENMSFGMVNYTDDKSNYFHYKDVEDEIIWSMLLDDITLENVYNQSDSHVSRMNISVSIPLLGYENKSLSITEEGYLRANILEIGEEFYIGKEKVQEFIDYVTNNYKNYVVY